MGMMANPKPGSKTEFYRDSMTVEAKAAFVHKHGTDAFLRLPAKDPEFEQRRSGMKGEEIFAFIRKHGAAAWDSLPE